VHFVGGQDEDERVVSLSSFGGERKRGSFLDSNEHHSSITAAFETKWVRRRLFFSVMCSKYAFLAIAVVGAVSSGGALLELMTPLFLLNKFGNM
jgi:hypothetical protein